MRVYVLFGYASGGGASTHQAVLLAMVQPVPGPPGSDDALQLVRLHPDQLVYPVVPPQLETLPAQLHSPARHVIIPSGSLRC